MICAHYEQQYFWWYCQMKALREAFLSSNQWSQNACIFKRCSSVGSCICSASAAIVGGGLLVLTAIISVKVENEFFMRFKIFRTLKNYLKFWDKFCWTENKKFKKLLYSLNGSLVLPSAIWCELSVRGVSTSGTIVFPLRSATKLTSKPMKSCSVRSQSLTTFSKCTQRMIRCSCASTWEGTDHFFHALSWKHGNP